LYDANHTKNEATRRFSRIFASKKQHHVYQNIQWINVPVNKVVVKGFFPPFFAAVVARNMNINMSPRGGCGVPPGDGGYDTRAK